MPTPTINFEKKLWDAANELRVAVSENNYKNYILPLVFVKHLSERYEIVHDELTYHRSVQTSIFAEIKDSLYLAIQCEAYIHPGPVIFDFKRTNVVLVGER